MTITEENLPIFIAVFVLVCVVAVVIMLVVSAKNRKKKKELLSDPNNVEIKFDCPVVNGKIVFTNPGQTCYVVHLHTESDAVLIGSSLITGLSSITFDVEHYQLGYNKNLAKLMGKDTVEIKVEKNHSYNVSFDYIDKVFEIVKK